MVPLCSVDIVLLRAMVSAGVAVGVEVHFEFMAWLYGGVMYWVVVCGALRCCVRVGVCVRCVVCGLSCSL